MSERQHHYLHIGFTLAGIVALIAAMFAAADVVVTTREVARTALEAAREADEEASRVEREASEARRRLDSRHTALMRRLIDNQDKLRTTLPRLEGKLESLIERGDIPR